MTPHRLFLWGIVSAIFFSSTGNANPIDMYGAGARGASMGGAHTAATRDSSANYYNPALLASLPQLEIDLGYRYIHPSLKLNDDDVHADVTRGARLSITVPGRIGGANMAVGLAMYLPDQQLQRIRSLNQTQPRFVLYDNRAQRLFLAVNVAFAITERLFVGAGVGYLAETGGTVTLLGRVGFPDAMDSDLRLDVDVDVRSNPYPNAGIAYQALPWLRLGASYRGKIQPVTDLSLDIIGSIGASNQTPIVEDAFVGIQTVSLSHFQPAEFSIGLDAKVGPSLQLAADLAYFRWSQYRNPAAQLLSELDVGEFNDLLKIPDEVALIPTDFQDILIPRVGAEWLAIDTGETQLHGRLGYSYEPSPAPIQTGATNFVDNNKHTISTGVGLTLKHWSSIVLQPLSLDVSFATTVLRSRDHHKQSPVDPVGDYRSHGVVWQFLTTTRIRF